MDEWHGHLPITIFVLLHLLEKTRDDQAAISQAERVLFTCCEFRAATASSELAAHLGSEPNDRLRAAQRAFCGIGADDTAGMLRAALETICGRAGLNSLRALAQELQRQLLTTSDRVDELIADYAWNCMLDSCVDLVSKERRIH
jgi:hypothetical protein